MGPGIFLIAMEQTVVATSIRVIADDFGGYSQQAWVTTAYLVTSTIVTRAVFPSRISRTSRSESVLTVSGPR